MNPIRLYLDREILLEVEGFLESEEFHAENWEKFFIEFVEKDYQEFFSYRFWSEALEEYVRRWEEQKILARLGMPERELTDEDVLDSKGFYTEEMQSVLHLWYVYDRSVEQVKHNRELARIIILQYWGIPEKTTADKWREYVEYREHTLIKERTNTLCEPSHVTMLLLISFLLNDDGETDDAWRCCITALTRNYQEVSKALDRAIAMLEGSVLRWEDQSILTSRDGEFDRLTTAIGLVMSNMNLRRLPGGIVIHRRQIVRF